MRRALLTTPSLLGLTGVSAAADPVTIASTHDGNLAAIRSLLPTDHPEGVKATVTLVSLNRARYMHDPMLSTFIVDYEPGGSVVLHRTPAWGYVLVQCFPVPSGRKPAGASVGTYRMRGFDRERPRRQCA